MKINKLIDLASKGDERAYDKLYREYSGKVYALCYSFLKNSADAEDMTQEAFFKASENLDKLNDFDKFESWLLSIAKNCCKEFLRKKKPIILKNENTIEIFSEIADENPTPEQEVINEETNKILQEMLGKLPKEQQEAVVLYYFEEKSVKAIASQSNCTEHCIRGRIKLGKKRIAKQLKHLEYKDKIAYMGACVAFGNLVKPVSTKVAGAGIGAVLGKITAAVVATAVVGFGGYGLHNLYILSEKEEQTAGVGNMNTYATELVSPDEKNNYLLKVSVPNNWFSYDEDEGIYAEYNEVISADYFETEYDSGFRSISSYIRQVGCFVDIGVFDAEYDINDASKAFEKHFYDEYHIEDMYDDIYDDIYAFREEVNFKVANDTLAVSYNEDKSWLFGLGYNRSTYFAIVDCGVMPNEPNLRYYALLEVDFEDGYHDQETFLTIAESIKIETLTSKSYTTVFKDSDEKFAEATLTSFVPASWSDVFNEVEPNNEYDKYDFMYSGVKCYQFFAAKEDEKNFYISSRVTNKMDVTISVVKLKSGLDIMQTPEKIEDAIKETYPDCFFPSEFQKEKDNLIISYIDKDTLSFTEAKNMYFAIKPCGSPERNKDIEYYVVIRAQFEDGYLTQETVVEIAESAKIDYRYYSVEKTKKEKYNYIVKDKNGDIMLRNSKPLRIEPKITDLDENILRVDVSGGAGISATKTVYCDVEKCETSEEFYSVLGEYKNYVLYVDYEDDEFKIIVQHIFNKNAFYQEYVLSDVYVAADPVISCDIDEDGLAEIVYLKGKEHNEVKIDIDIEELLENRK